MRDLNFNAVRCSHYPTDEAFYAICDELGMYVVDEANIETHGFFYAPYGDEGALAKLPSWRGAFWRGSAGWCDATKTGRA